MEEPVETRPVQLTLGAVIGWLLFSFVTLSIGAIALPHAGRLYDFREFYSAGYLLLHAPHQIFDLAAQEAVQNAVVFPMQVVVPFYHPAYEAILFAPLSLISYRSAYFVFGILNLLLLALCYRIAPVAADTRIRRIPRPLLFFVCFPALIAIVQGQDSILFLFLMCLVWRALASGHERTAGILLALALFKLQIALPVLFFLAVYLRGPRRARLLLSWIPSAAFVALICLLITGPRGMAAWFHFVALSSIASHVSHHPQLIAVYSRAMPTLNGLLYVCGARFLPSRISLALDALLSLIVFAATLYLMRTLTSKPANKSGSLPVAFCAALAAAILLSPHLFLYDFVLLLFPILLLQERSQPLVTAIYYLLPIVLFCIKGLDLFAFMAVVPVMILTSLLLTERSHRLHQIHSEEATPHPLTALE